MTQHHEFQARTPLEVQAAPRPQKQRHGGEVELGGTGEGQGNGGTLPAHTDPMEGDGDDDGVPQNGDSTDKGAGTRRGARPGWGAQQVPVDPQPYKIGREGENGVTPPPFRGRWGIPHRFVGVKWVSSPSDGSVSSCRVSPGRPSRVKQRGYGVP